MPLPPEPGRLHVAVYVGCDEITGPLQPADSPATVRYREVLDGRARRRLRWMVALNLATSAAFLVWLALPERLPALLPFGRGGFAAGRLAFLLILVVEMLRFLQVAVLWVFARTARDPVPVEAEPGSRVAIMTTIVPDREPMAMVAETLRAMKQVEYDGQVDVWILDEGDDPAVKRMADELGVMHFSRKGRPEYNQAKGAYRARSKAGNHNAWRAEHEWKYDFVAQMDPDHVPVRSFLKRTLGYFSDPDVAFVVAPQVYCNMSDGFVARAAAVQGYVFHGIIQRGGNGLGAPLLIGTNHLYRTRAWGQLGGYQDCVIEDHLTSLHVHSRTNPLTSRRWRGVYTPDIIARGDGPRTWTDYFNQQRRWAYGVTQIVLRHSPRLFRRLEPGQRWAYAGLQFFYPSLGIVWILGNVLVGLYLFTGIAAIRLSPWLPVLWGLALGARVWLFLWLRRFNLARHERTEMGLNGMLLHLMTGPIYASAAAAAAFRRPLSYVVTAKGELSSPDSLRTFRTHFYWLAMTLAALGAGAWRRDTPPFVVFWAVVTLCATIVPVLLHALARPKVANPSARPQEADRPALAGPVAVPPALLVAGTPQTTIAAGIPHTTGDGHGVHKVLGAPPAAGMVASRNSPPHQRETVIGALVPVQVGRVPGANGMTPAHENGNGRAVASHGNGNGNGNGLNGNGNGSNGNGRAVASHGNGNGSNGNGRAVASHGNGNGNRSNGNGSNGNGNGSNGNGSNGNGNGSNGHGSNGSKLNLDLLNSWIELDTLDGSVDGSPGSGSSPRVKP